MSQWMSTIDEMLTYGVPLDYVAHVDGPRGWQAVERFEVIEGQALATCHLRDGSTLRRIRHAPVFLSTQNESGL